MPKRQETIKTVIRPLLVVPFEFEQKKKKKTKEKETQLLGVHHVFRNSATAISRETQHVFMFLLLLSSEHITQLPLLGTLVLGEASFKFWLCSRPVLCV